MGCVGYLSTSTMGGPLLGLVLGFLLLACLCGAAAAQGRPIHIARRVAPLSSIRGATGGSLQAVVTASGVETTKRAFQPQLLNQILGSLHLPTISGQTPITLLGITVNLHYQVGNISISNVTFANGNPILVHHTTERSSLNPPPQTLSTSCLLVASTLLSQMGRPSSMQTLATASPASISGSPINLYLSSHHCSC